jgi:hypothetical protein
LHSKKFLFLPFFCGTADGAFDVSPWEEIPSLGADKLLAARTNWRLAANAFGDPLPSVFPALCIRRSRESGNVFPPPLPLPTTAALLDVGCCFCLNFSKDSGSFIVPAAQAKIHNSLFEI